MQAAGEGLREFAGAAKGLLGEPGKDEGGREEMNRAPAAAHNGIKNPPGEAKCS